MNGQGLDGGVSGQGNAAGINPGIDNAMAVTFVTGDQRRPMIYLHSQAGVQAVPDGLRTAEIIETHKNIAVQAQAKIKADADHGAIVNQADTVRINRSRR